MTSSSDWPMVLQEQENRERGIASAKARLLGLEMAKLQTTIHNQRCANRELVSRVLHLEKELDKANRPAI